MVNKQPAKAMDKNFDKTTGLYKIAAKIIKKVKTGCSYKTQLYQAQYPNKLTLNAVLMNVFKWEKVIDILIEKSQILEKENNMDPELVYVLITELMWSKFGLKGSAKNILAIKKYKTEFLKLIKDNELDKLISSEPTKVWKPRFFRVNTLVTTIEDILKKLSDLKYQKLKTPKTYAEFLQLIKSDKFKVNTFVQDIHIKEILVFNPKVKFYQLEEYNNGSLIIQDKASCLAAHLLNPEPESTVLDMCAAPGMKTSHLAALMQNKGKLYAVDRCKDRYSLMNNMLEKYSVTNVETFNMDALTFPYQENVKYILVDPSCSGSGIVDRVRSDSKGNENFQVRLKKLANVHAQLLNHALKSYPDLERLVYSTCSENAEENEAVVDEALSVNGKFKLLDCTKMIKGWTNKGAPGYDCSEMCLNAVPNDDCTNGFFIAVFVRRDFEEKEIDEEEATEELDESNDKMDVDDADQSQISNPNESQNESDKSTGKKKSTKKIKKAKKNNPIESVPANESDKSTKKIKKAKNNNPIESVPANDSDKSTEKNNKPIESVPANESDKSTKKIKKAKNNKPIESVPPKKSKNAKRQERRMKLEQANGKITTPKTKRVKRKKTAIAV